MIVEEDIKKFIEKGKSYLKKNDLYGFYTDILKEYNLNYDNLYKTFMSCGIDIMKEFQKVGKIPSYAFREVGTNQFKLKIPEGIEIIDDYAFAYCMTKIDKLPSTLQYIGISAFWGCEFIDSVLIIPKSVEYIGGYSFMECKFKKVIFEGIPKSIGEYAFSFDEQLKEICVPWDEEYSKNNFDQYWCYTSLKKVQKNITYNYK